MLSILIPTYNYNCYGMVSYLHEMAIMEGVAFEIIVMDDASTEPPKENKAIANLQFCQFIELKHNVGRSRIRNLLAATAKYNNLLFIDNDGAIRNNTFVRDYLRYINTEGVVCGGRSYHPHAPADKNYLLHWKYGSSREVIALERRLRNPYKSFMTNNFMIHKSIFDKVHFKENISRYGHEDTIFGLDLKRNLIPVTHINNPVEHIGLDLADIIIQKEKDSVKNLIHLLVSNQGMDFLADEIKLVRTYKIIHKLYLCSLLGHLYPVLNKLISAQLQSKYPILALFDILKLSYFCNQANKTDNLSQHLFDKLQQD